ncbi:hypothetical protein FBU30_010831 [Linnemannia zychae]|nr:hypothetical protein FBU30_010831 [Linnemannia zychae]
MQAQDIPKFATLLLHEKKQYRNMIVEDRYYEDTTIVPSQQDAREWLQTIAPGRLITTLLTDIGLPADRHNDKPLNPHVTTIGCTDGYLMEARNIFSNAIDMKNLLATDPSQVAVLSLDFGASCLVGATVSPPPGQTSTTYKRPTSEGNQRKKKSRRAKRKPGDRK